MTQVRNSLFSLYIVTQSLELNFYFMSKGLHDNIPVGNESRLVLTIVTSLQQPRNDRRTWTYVTFFVLRNKKRGTLFLKIRVNNKSCGHKVRR